MPQLTTTDDFNRHVEMIEAQDGYRRPAAFGIGLVTFKDTLDGSVVLDTHFAAVNCGENFGTAAVLSEKVVRLKGSQTTPTTPHAMRRWVSDLFHPFLHDGQKHGNIEALLRVAEATRPSLDQRSGYYTQPVVVFIGDLDAPPKSTEDVYLRLHLLSHRKVRPHGVNLDGQFGLLANVAWTNIGPLLPEDVDEVEWALRADSRDLSVTSVDKFPRMLDYVRPSGVRIADGERVRLGAHLAEGTTVMHEGFCNFNAGTLGKAMVEGRISAGVVIGNDTDIGGGASIMGTLSGGGKEVISVGEHCLIGANAGIGISLGDHCVVEAGLYITAGTIVTMPDGTTRKAHQLSKRDGMLFRRNSVTGAVEVLPRKGKESTLNDELHAN